MSLPCMLLSEPLGYDTLEKPPGVTKELDAIARRLARENPRNVRWVSRYSHVLSEIQEMVLHTILFVSVFRP